MIPPKFPRSDSIPADWFKPTSTIPETVKEAFKGITVIVTELPLPSTQPDKKDGGDNALRSKAH